MKELAEAKCLYKNKEMFALVFYVKIKETISEIHITKLFVITDFFVNCKYYFLRTGFP